MRSETWNIFGQRICEALGLLWFPPLRQKKAARMGHGEFSNT